MEKLKRVFYYQPLSNWSGTPKKRKPFCRYFWNGRIIDRYSDTVNVLWEAKIFAPVFSYLKKKRWEKARAMNK